MRYVPYNPEHINYPVNWENEVETAKQAVTNCPNEQKSAEINRHSNVWKDLKPELKKIMHSKCWYTEAIQEGTDTDVDHYRPKNSVKGEKNALTNETHPGYWWKAFDPSNYRYSCIVANRLRRDLETGIVSGKADEFPLWDNAQRAWGPNDNCDNERPLLIDPCKPADVALISFAPNGEATERYSKTQNDYFYERAHKSIILYHLNHSDFTKARIKIRNSIKKNIEDAKRAYAKLGTPLSDAFDDYVYNRAIEELRNACSEEAPYSSFAISLLKPYRDDKCFDGVLG